MWLAGGLRRYVTVFMKRTTKGLVLVARITAQSAVVVGRWERNAHGQQKALTMATRNENTIPGSWCVTLRTCVGRGLFCDFEQTPSQD